MFWQKVRLEFIGKTELAKDCKILNPEALHFEFNPKENILTAFARRPLKIKHKGLGYLITYDLVNFIRRGNYVSYLGYARYENLKGGKNKQKRWKQNRILTYKGSRIHFFKSLIKSSMSSMPTLSLIKESVIPLFNLNSFGIEACVIVAG